MAGAGSFDGLGMHLGNLARLSNAETRSISAENFDGREGRGRHGDRGHRRDRGPRARPGLEGLAQHRHRPAARRSRWPRSTGPGAIQHIWLTVHPTHWRRLVLRVLLGRRGDAVGRDAARRLLLQRLVRALQHQLAADRGQPGRRLQLLLGDAVPQARPDHAREPRAGRRSRGFYYQIDYTLTDVPDDRGLLPRPVAAQQSAALPGRSTRCSTACEGQGHYVGTYLAWGVNNNGWWGEGEIKFYLDGDGELPTICGTGTEDYFGGAWNFEHPKGEYGVFSTPFLGLPQVIKPDGLYRSQQRFGMYRWHVMDPIRFEQDLRVTIQALGWRSALEGKRATCRCRTTSPRPRSGTRPSRTRRSRRCRMRTSWR